MINTIGTCSADLFNMKINYHTANAALGATALYNGNISSLEWTTGASCLVNGVTRNRAGYGYAYDSNNRLTRAKYGEYTGGSWNTALNNYNTDTVTYDRNGNIKTMTNRGRTGSAFGPIDQLSYSYDAAVPNRLLTVGETSSTTKGFKTLGGSGYTYDANGNVTVDSYKGITRTVYNYLNLPDTVFFGSKYLNFTYDAGGTKWRKKTVDGATVTEKHYLAGIEYTGTTLEAIYHSEGRARPLGGGIYEYQYTIKDHLGNSRVMYKVMAGTATLIQVGAQRRSRTAGFGKNHYYAFGVGLENIAFIDSTNKYRYNSKEMINDFGLESYDYGARYYGVTIGRWGQVDPTASTYTSWSPFNYVRANPIIRIDPTGRWDVMVHLFNDRAKFGYGIAVVYDRLGNEVYRFNVRAEGIKGRNRTITGSDTPLGVYDIPDDSNRAWITGGARKGLDLMPDLF